MGHSRGRARSSARGAVAWNRWHFRHVGGPDECRSACRWPCQRGAEGARTALENFWRRVSEAARFSPLRRGPLDVIFGRWTLDSRLSMSPWISCLACCRPYDLNPIGKQFIASNSGRNDRFRAAGANTYETLHHRYQCSDRPSVFKNNAVTPDVLLASACLPTMFQAIEIDGEPYWDGGYSGNPTITPLIRECKSQDTILVQINPVEREKSPRSASEILNRLIRCPSMRFC